MDTSTFRTPLLHLGSLRIRPAFMTCKRVLFAGLTAALPLMATQASAQTVFDRLVVFGDSYVDNGNLQRIPFNNAPYPMSGQSPSASAASGANPYIVWPVWLQSMRGMSDSQVVNYAIGGSTTQAMNAIGVPFSLPYQMAAIAGQTFSPRDLVLLSVGGNDVLSASGPLHQFGYGADGLNFTPQRAVELGQQATAGAMTAINQMVGAGVRNIVFAGADVSGLPVTVLAPHPESLPVFGQTYWQGMQNALAPLGQAGVRIFMLDQGRLSREIGENLAAHGLQSYAASPGAVALFQPDGIHLSSAGFQVVARYVNNLIGAPDTIAAQADIGQTAINQFTGSMFQRLDAARSTNGNRAAYAAIPDGNYFTKATARPVPEQRLSVFMSGDYASGSRADRDGASGFNYQLAGGTVGLNYKIDPNLTVGGAFSYVNPTANLFRGSGRIDLDAYQFGGFASLNFASWFADFVVAYGHNNYNLDRPGVIDTIYGRTGGDNFSVGFKTGYLVDVGSLRVGPVAGLNYVNTSVNSYMETGDPLLTFKVSQNNLESLTGSAGVQLRTSWIVGQSVVNPYLNLTAEHDFLGQGRTLLSIETQAPLVPIYTKVPGFGSETYGKLAGGVTTQFSDRLMGSINLAGTFARDSGNDFAVSGNIKVAIDPR